MNIEHIKSEIVRLSNYAAVRYPLNLEIKFQLADDRTIYGAISAIGGIETKLQ